MRDEMIKMRREPRGCGWWSSHFPSAFILLPIFSNPNSTSAKRSDGSALSGGRDGGNGAGLPMLDGEYNVDDSLDGKVVTMKQLTY